jgi:tRNA threonylcarbamoyladenosine biosynthesis protein TsaE
MKQIEFHASSLAHTDRLGAALAAVLPAATTVGLRGTLGAGKTRLVQAIAVALDVPQAEVVSPTYVLCHEYEGRIPLYHLDVYRLRDDDEFLELGPEEYFESAGITLIEWADRVVDCLPRDRIEIDIQITGTSQRRFEITALGTRAEAILEALQAKLKVTE